mgnify:CR=1 FL=1
MAKASLQSDRHGWFVEWYRDGDDDSGQGADPEICRWYGTCVECRARMTESAPETGWVSVGSDQGSPPHDAATATGMYDHW